MFTAGACPFHEIDNENYLPRFGVNNADSAAQTVQLSGSSDMRVVFEVRTVGV